MHGITTYLQWQSAQVKGDKDVGGGVEANKAEVDVLDEVFCMVGEELVGGVE